MMISFSPLAYQIKIIFMEGAGEWANKLLNGCTSWYPFMLPFDLRLKLMWLGDQCSAQRGDTGNSDAGSFLGFQGQPWPMRSPGGGRGDAWTSAYIWNFWSSPSDSKGQAEFRIAILNKCQPVCSRVVLGIESKFTSHFPDSSAETYPHETLRSKLSSGTPCLGSSLNVQL